MSAAAQWRSFRWTVWAAWRSLRGRCSHAAKGLHVDRDARGVVWTEWRCSLCDAIVHARREAPLWMQRADA